MISKKFILINFSMCYMFIIFIIITYLKNLKYNIILIKIKNIK